MAIKTRRARRQDRPALLEIWLAASRTGHGFLGEAVLQQQVPTIRDVYLEKADNWVASEMGNVIGFIGLLGNHVGGLFVSPEHHRRGAASLLIKQAAERLGSLTVEVYEQNVAAIAFYESAGFKAFARKELDDEGRSFPLLRMLLDVSAVRIRGGRAGDRGGRATQAAGDPARALSNQVHQLGRDS